MPGPIEWVPRRGGLTIEEREEILRGLSRGDSLRSIAHQLGRLSPLVAGILSSELKYHLDGPLLQVNGVSLRR